jgi:hypothetical protein
MEMVKLLLIVLLVASCSSPNLPVDKNQTRSPRELWKLEPGLYAKAKRDGLVSVLVTLNQDTRPEHRDIKFLQDELIAKLAGTRYKVR